MALVILIAALLSWFLIAGRGRPKPALSPSEITGPVPTRVLQWTDEVIPEARAVDLDPRLVLALIWQESGGDPNARGTNGEVGLGQVKDAAAQQVGFRMAPWTPILNIRATARYLAWIKQQAGRGEGLPDVIGMYNQGPTGFRQKVGAREAGLRHARLVLARYNIISKFTLIPSS